MTGNNETKSNFMTTAAGRKWLDNGGYVGVVYGYTSTRGFSRLKIVSVEENDCLR